MEVTAATGFTNAGTIRMTATSSCGYDILAITSGTLTNNGTINAEAGGGAQQDIRGALSNSHVLSVGAEVNLQLEGSYTQTGTGTLEIAIHGKSPGHLTVSGATMLAGGLKIVQSAFEGEAGEQTTVISGGSRTGEFAHITGQTISPSLYWRGVYLGKSVALEVTAGEAPVKAPTNETTPTIEGAARQGSTVFTTNGAWTHAPFEYTYQWLRCESSGSGCKAIAEATDQNYLLTAADVGHRISVQVTAYNAGGESPPAEPAAPTPVVAGVPLTAVAGEDISLVEGDSALLDGSGSAPAPEITNYRWQFGDGSEAEGPGDATLHHTYAEAGKYEAKLTVTRGSEHQTDSLIVTVNAKPKAGEGARITVQDAAKAPVPGAGVLFVGPDGHRIEASSNSGGEAVLAGLPTGEDTVYVYKSGFKPATKTLSVDAKGNGTGAVTLTSGEVATSGLTSHELTLSQIEAAGIDPSNPANQHVYEFEVKLAFFAEAEVEIHGDVNSAGEFVGPVAGGGGGGEWTCTPTACTGTDGGGGGEIIAVPEVVEGHPLIQWLIFRGKAAILKQFFEVDMVVQNLSSEEPFTLAPGSATLNLPAGMSLAPTPEPQQLSHSIGTIKPLGSAETNWIIRGDEPGSYSPSVSYTSKLEPFKAPVELLAGLAHPLEVFGVEKLALKVQADNTGLTQGYPYHVKIGIEDTAPVPFYNVKLSINPDEHQNFIFQPGQRFETLAVAELKPNQPQYGDELIVAPDNDSVGTLNPAKSSATFLGQEVHEEEGIEAVPPPRPTYTGEALSGTPNTVHLHWGAVPGAEGYEIFSTADRDTPFQATPDQAGASAGEARSAKPLTGLDGYLEGTEGKTRYYAISALIEGHPTLAIPLVPASAEGGSGLPELGRCLLATPANHGGFTDSKCTKASTGSTGKYEFTPGPGNERHFGASGRKTTLETVSKAKISCTGATGSGEYTGPQSATASVDFTGCELTSPKAKCQSTGAASGEVRSASLEGSLGFISKTPKLVTGWDLKPASAGQHVAALTCGSTSVTIDGSVIAPISAADKMTSAFQLKLKAKKGLQSPERLLEQAPDTLAFSFAGGSAEQGGLTSTLSLTAGEKLEIKAVG